MPIPQIPVRGPAPFKNPGIYETTIHVVGSEPDGLDIISGKISSLWKQDFHLSITDGMYSEVLGSPENPLPKGVLALKKVWIVAVDQFSPLFSVFDVDVPAASRSDKKSKPVVRNQPVKKRDSSINHLYEGVLELDPFTAHYKKGRSSARLGGYEEALAYYDRALELDSQNSAAYRYKGSALDALGRYVEALECYDRALELDSGNCIVYFNKGNSLELLGRHKEAFRHYSKAMDLDPVSVYNYIMKTYTPDSRGIHEEALAYLSRHKITRVGHTPLAGARERALVHFNKMRDLNLVSVYAYTYKIDLLVLLGSYEEIPTYCNKVLAMHPQNRHARALKREVLAQLSKHGGVSGHQGKTSELDPRDNHAHEAESETLADLNSGPQTGVKENGKLIEQYKRYQERLLQVTAKNRSVLLKTIYKKHNFDVTRLEEFKEGTIQRITSKILENIRSVLGSNASKIASVSILRDSVDSEDADSVRSRLKTLSRNFTHVEEETGQQAGYIGFPFLEGHISNDFYVRGPLALFPISLVRSRKERGQGWVIELANERPILNGALLASLKKKGSYNLPEDYEESFNDMIEDVTNAPSDIERYFFDRVREWIEKIVPIGTNRNIFSTQPLHKLNKDSIDEMERQQLHLVNYKIIGSFPQADDQIYKDYNYLSSDTTHWPGVVGSLLDVEPYGKTKQDYSPEWMNGDGSCELDKVNDDQINTVLESDSSQDEVIVRSKDMDLLVVRGPPGTGKSQVIVNLIADALMNNKKVLVVCQKRAALEVVRQRLEEVGLDRYAVFLAKETDDRILMYEQIRSTIETRSAAPANTVKDISQEIDSRVRYLSELGTALGKNYFEGATAHKIYAKAASSYRPVLNFSPTDLGLTWKNLNGFIEGVSRLEELFKKLEDRNHPWFGRKGFSKFGMTEGAQLDVLLQELLSMHTKCLLAESQLQQEQLERHFTEHLRHSAFLKDSDLPELEPDEATQLDVLLQELLSMHTKCLLVDNLLLQSQLERCMNGYQQSAGWLKRKKRKEYAREVSNILSITDLDKDFVDRNIGPVRKGVEFWKKLSELPGYLGYNKREVLEKKMRSGESAFSVLQEIKAAREAYRSQHTAADGIKRVLEIHDMNEGFAGENLERVKQGIKFWEKLFELLGYFDDDRQKILMSKMKRAETIASILREMKESLDVDELQYFDREKAESKEGVLRVLEQARDRMKPNSKWSEMIREEVYFCWLAQIEQENPILKGRHPDEYQRERKHLEELMKKKRQAVREDIQSRIESVIHPDEVYDRRSPNSKAWRNLLKELQKKRKIKPVRKMFEEYDKQMFEVAPCWLASPESVSKIFPMQRNLFDLTIVDEASQLAVERAIPFLYRSNHVVVAGDENQLPPFDLFQVIEDDEDDDLPEKSLLELARPRFKVFNLCWHYRSRYQDLINFSNHAFYDGILNVAPSVDRDPKSPSIRWVQCNGRWEDSKNSEEAKVVVREVKKAWKMGFDRTGNCPSVGIITFNEPQQDLVQDEVDKMLDADLEFAEMYNATRKDRRDSWLFVKNIENVQGDERDVIIFSIGYARNAEGRVYQAFGSLSKKGGENRLNVAVTRARQKMVVVCSIDPTDIAPTSKNYGPRRLRQFLQYAKATASQNRDAQRAILKEINPSMDRITKQKVYEFDSDFEMQVCKGLERRGYEVDSQVGYSGYVIDLAVCRPDDPSRYAIGIECDGAMFHSAKSVKERDVRRQKFLENKEWRIERVWSRNWWKNPDRELDRIVDVIKGILHAETQSATGGQ